MTLSIPINLQKRLDNTKYFIALVLPNCNINWMSMEQIWLAEESQSCVRSGTGNNKDPTKGMTSTYYFTNPTIPYL